VQKVGQLLATKTLDTTLSHTNSGGERKCLMSDRTRLQRKFNELMQTVYPGTNERQLIDMRNAFFAGTLAVYKQLKADPGAEEDIHAELKAFKDSITKQAPK
jgi:hypothetical protein